MSFEWGKVPPVTVRKLAGALGITNRDPSQGLRARYGESPGSSFVDEAWGPMRDEWLSRDRAAARRLAEALQSRGAGSKDLPIRNHEQRLAYLRSCRISKAVREEALKAFLEAHGVKLSSPLPPSRAQRGGATAVGRRSRSVEVTSDDPADPVADMAATMRNMQSVEVPSFVFTLMVFVAMALDTNQDMTSDELPAAVASSLMMALVTGGLEADQHQNRAEVAQRAMPADVRRTANRIALGARRWHQHRSPLELLFQVEHLVRIAVSQGLTARHASTVGPGLALQAMSSVGSEEAISLEEAGSLIGWTRRSMVDGATADAPSTSTGSETPRTPHRPQVEPRPVSAEVCIEQGSSVTARAVQRRKDRWHPNVIAAFSTIEPDEPLEDIERGGRWWASSAGGTAVWAGSKVASHGHRVQPIMVDTRIQPKRRIGDVQLAAALSDSNIHGGVAQTVLIDGRVHFRSSIAVHSGIVGWTGPWVGVAMYASAMMAHHAPPEFRGGAVSGPFGERVRPNHLIADYSGWHVPEEDSENFVLPTRALIAQALDRLPTRIAKYKVRKTQVDVRLAGPNGRFEGFFGRRRGRSDDQQLTVSVVTRPPWGAGVKCTLLIKTGADERENQRVAVEVNRLEWELLPTVNVWGGWSGENDCLRLTMFVPHMLMAPDVEGSLNVVTNMLQWAIVRGNTVGAAVGR